MLPAYSEHEEETAKLFFSQYAQQPTRFLPPRRSRLGVGKEAPVSHQIESLQEEIARCQDEIRGLKAEPHGTARHYWTIARLQEQIDQAQSRIEWLEYEDELRYVPAGR